MPQSATVIMNSYDYRIKMTLRMIGSYNKLKKDLTSIIEKKVRDKINKYNNNFTPFQTNRLISHYTTPRYFYGLPKIYNFRTLMRPIVTSLGSPIENSSKFIL